MLTDGVSSHFKMAKRIISKAQRGKRLYHFTWECWKEAACWSYAKTSADLFVCWRIGSFWLHGNLIILYNCWWHANKFYILLSIHTQDSICILKHLYWTRTRRSSFKNPKPNLWLSTPDFTLHRPHLHEWQLQFSRAQPETLGGPPLSYHRSHSQAHSVSSTFQSHSQIQNPVTPHHAAIASLHHGLSGL